MQPRIYGNSPFVWTLACHDMCLCVIFSCDTFGVISKEIAGLPMLRSSSGTGSGALLGKGFKTTPTPTQQRLFFICYLYICNKDRSHTSQSLDAIFHMVQRFQEDNRIHQDQLLELILSSADQISPE